jgi:hypothetical protein
MQYLFERELEGLWKQMRRDQEEEASPYQGTDLNFETDYTIFVVSVFAYNKVNVG